MSAPRKQDSGAQKIKLLKIQIAKEEELKSNI